MPTRRWFSRIKRAKPGANPFPSKPTMKSARSWKLPIRSDRTGRSTLDSPYPLMPYRFLKHYTRAEARKLLPQIRRWLKRAQDLRVDLEKQDERLGAMMEPGRDLGGPLVNAWVRTMADLKDAL